ncbi:MAG: hypothetical protein GWN97_13480, partial [Thermoplasmata archaeon]|nr:hypothetical protein [Thermoplasmata archaeon]NIT78209.1 hypothetical protein [Thermoplasmata archaeon]NIY04579.1 hypothetical protein [Thermoplasmata archaeon]
MTLEELKKYRAWVEPLAEERESGWKLSGSTEEVLNLAEGMLKIAAIAEATGGVVGVYQALWKDEGGWVA